MNFNGMKKTELTLLARKYTKKKCDSLKGDALKFAVWAYKRRGLDPSGVSFSVGESLGHNCFCSDGKPYSFVKAIKNDVESSHKTNVLKAFRWAVNDDIQPLRRKGMHVDHIIPFHAILSDFFIDNDLKLKDIKVMDVDRTGTIKKLCDLDIECKFQIYHKKVARLRVIPAEDNLKKGATEDIALYRYRLARNETYDR